MTFGRSGTNDRCYAADHALSRQHLVFERNAGAWTVRDLESKNGTFGNGFRLATTHLLRPGDRITAGRLTMVCRSSSEEAMNSRVLVGEAAPSASKEA